MPRYPRILIVGTADTKADELLFIKKCIETAGATANIMDVGVLGKPSFSPEYPAELVAKAAGTTLDAIAALGGENQAFQVMSLGAANFALALYEQHELDGVLALGGTMGTDLALDVATALPVGLPKMIVSTVAFSHLIPADRLAPDLMMMLWAGGLYGLNSLCRSVLSQAAGAILGACRSVVRRDPGRPAIAISSLGKSCLNYMVKLKPEIEKRGYEAVVFHCTGMGGRAMEWLIDRGAFVAVFDFALGEVSNLLHGSVVNAGPTRLEAAGRRGIPQIVSPGAADMIDLQAWAPMPASLEGRKCHAHNRLIASTTTTADERRGIARYISNKLNQASGPTAFLLPREGIHAWDVGGQELHDPVAHAAFCEEFRLALGPHVAVHDLNMHINDPAFVDHALAVFDDWIRHGMVPIHAQGSGPQGSTTNCVDNNPEFR